MATVSQNAVSTPEQQDAASETPAMRHREHTGSFGVIVRVGPGLSGWLQPRKAASKRQAAIERIGPSRTVRMYRASSTLHSAKRTILFRFCAGNYVPNCFSV